ncbi:MAG TPA: type VI secretion system protein TssA [Pirellulales bacterium]|nr:type VI secretion system protein TssA [Pirellulales bacterium]
MPYESSFGELESSGGRAARAAGENPFRVALLGDFSGRTQRQPPEGRDELFARKPIKVSFDTLDEVLESTAPSVEFTAADGDVEVRLEPTELDDFQPDPIYRNIDRLSDLEGEEAAALMREIMHNPLYQGLESAWRGLEWLLRRTQKNARIQIVLLDMTAEEFAADLIAESDLRATAVYRQLIEKLAEGVDPMPWSVLAGIYTFEETTAHAEVLGRMARIAARAQAPFLSAITAQVVQEGYEVPADGKPAWEALRKLPEAAYLGLAAPRFLLRPPFGENYRPAESLTFEEFAGTPNDYLWASPALACAALLAQGFTQSGWGFQPAQFLSLGGMPMHTYRDAEGEPVAVCGEGRFTSSTSQGLVQRGFMPLLSVRGRDAIELACIRSMELEGGALAGPWVGGTPTKKAATAGGGQVGMMAGTTGLARPNREGPAAVSARRPDPEIDPDLASLLSGGSDSPPDERSDDAPPEESPLAEQAPPDEQAEPELDPELAALLAGPPPEETPPEEDPGLDPELAALLGDSPPDESALDPELAALLAETPAEEPPADEPPAVEPAEDAIDPDLAALLGDTPSEESPIDDSAIDPELAALLGDTPSEEPPADDSALDPDLAALLGDSLPDASDEAAAPPSDDVDPELAALLGEAEPASEPATADESALDPELAALLGDSAGGDEPVSNSAEPEPIPDDIPEPSAATALADSSPPSDEPSAGEPSSNLQSRRDSSMASADDDSEMGDSAAVAVPTAEEIEARMIEVQETSHYGVPGTGSPPVIDFLSLLQPISADEPAGGSVPFDVKEELEQARKEINPESFAADDPTRPEDYVRADWSRIIALSQETLREKSKNLLVACRLLEGLSKKNGFVGLRDGMHLLRLLVEVCWNFLEPPVEDEDLEVRAAPFHWIDDPDRGAVFPNSVRSMPLLSAGGTSFTWSQWQQAQGGPGKGGDVVEKTIAAANREQCQLLVDNLSQAVMELKFLSQHLGSKLGSDAPGFTSLRPAMDDCLRLAKQILQRKGPPPSEAGAVEENGEQTDDGQAAGGPAVAMGRPRLSTREDIYRALAEAADALERLEPHSPVPFLVRRAVELGALPFPMLMAALIRDTAVLSEMNRELGIKEPAAE